jgi:hypothetical protein
MVYGYFRAHNIIAIRNQSASIKRGNPTLKTREQGGKTNLGSGLMNNNKPSTCLE